MKCEDQTINITAFVLAVIAEQDLEDEFPSEPGLYHCKSSSMCDGLEWDQPDCSDWTGKTVLCCDLQSMNKQIWTGTE